MPPRRLTTEAHLEPQLRSVGIGAWMPRRARARTAWPLLVALIALNELRGVAVAAAVLKAWTG